MKSPNWPNWETLIKTDSSQLLEDIIHRHWFDPSYHPSMLAVARHNFPGLERIAGSYSQSMQDIFVLTLLNGKTNGIYLELGCNHPIKYNNTYLLTKFGWHGLSVDIDERFSKVWQTERPDDKFLAADATQLDYNLALKDFPCVIDYLQIDTDTGSGDVDILQKLLSTNKRFGFISFEHEQIYQQDSSTLFLEYGYKRMAKNIICKDFKKNSWHIYEDWWVDPNLVQKEILEKFKDNQAEISYPFELFCVPGSVDHLMQLVQNQKDIWKNL
jgi:hypothetical protein